MRSQAQQASLAGVDPTGARITFWYQHSGDRDKAMQEMLAEFNRTNPWKITVRGEYAGPYDQIYNKMIAAIAAGRPPELVVAYQNQSATYAASQALVDLDPYVHDPKWGIGGELGDFFKGFINQDVTTQFGGMRLGFPPNRSIEVLYYNASMLRAAGITAPPRTWDEFAADCRAVTSAPKGTYGYALDNLDASHIFAFVISRGGGFTTPDGKGYMLDTPQMKESMLFMRKLLTAGAGAQDREEVRRPERVRQRKLRVHHRLDLGPDLLRQRREIREERAVRLEHRAHPPGRPVAVSRHRPVRGERERSEIHARRSSSPRGFSSRWFSEPRQQAAWTHVSLYFPVRRSVEPLIRDILRSNRRFAAAWELLKSADLRSEPAFAGYDLVRDAISAAYSRVLDGADVDSTLSALQAQAQQDLPGSRPLSRAGPAPISGPRPAPSRRTAPARSRGPAPCRGPCCARPARPRPATGGPRGALR